MTNPQNLRVPTSEQAREYGRKGGKVKSLRKKLAARLTALKRKGLTDENCKKIYEFMTDKNMSALDIYLATQKMLSMAKTVSDHDKFVSKLIELHKLVHGTKQDEDQTNMFNANQIKIIIEEGSNKKVEVRDESAD